MTTLLFLALTGAGRADLCGDRGVITLVKESGGIIIVNGNILWDVEKDDRETAAYWLPGERVVVCGDRMMNLENLEVIRVKETKTVIRTPAGPPVQAGGENDAPPAQR